MSADKAPPLSDYPELLFPTCSQPNCLESTERYNYLIVNTNQTTQYFRDFSNILL